MNKLLLLCSIILTTGCILDSAGTIKYGTDENTRPEDYAHIKDPTGTFEEKVHRFQITSKCGSLQRKGETGNKT